MLLPRLPGKDNGLRAHYSQHDYVAPRSSPFPTNGRRKADRRLQRRKHGNEGIRRRPPLLTLLYFSSSPAVVFPVGLRDNWINNEDQVLSRRILELAHHELAAPRRRPTMNPPRAVTGTERPEAVKFRLRRDSMPRSAANCLCRRVTRQKLPQLAPMNPTQ